MNAKYGLAMIAAVLLTLSGCASMSSEECIASDWSAIGYEDGARGYTSERFSTHRKACAKHGVTADFGAYQGGREQGLVEYCQPGRGFSVGVNGGSYSGVCDANLEADFLDAYNAGHRLYALRSEVNRANSSIYNKEREKKRIENLQVENGIALVAADTTTEDRVRLLAEMKELSERSGTLDAEIIELYDIRARAQAELEQYQVIVADMGY